MRRFGGRFKNFTALLMAVVICITPLYSDASSTKEQRDKAQQELNDAQSERQQVEKDKKDAETKAKNLTKDAQKISGQIDKLNGQIDSVMADISETTDKIETVNGEIEVVTAELNDVIAKSDFQYNSMKARIQYMYEFSSKSVVADLLESGSVSEMIKKVEYMSAITSYDQKMLEEYAKVQAEVEEKKAQLEAKQQELLTLEASLNEKKGELNGLVSSANKNLENTKSQLSDANAAIADYESQIKEMKEKEKELMASYMEAQLAYSKEIGVNYEDLSGALEGYTDSDVLMLAAMIQAEAANQGDAGRLAVGSVIMNRVFSSSFPNTIAGVISAPNQFAPYASGRFAAILAQGPNAACISAAQACIGGYRNVNKLFFCTQSQVDVYNAKRAAEGRGNFYDDYDWEIIGAHVFYNRK